MATPVADEIQGMTPEEKAQRKAEKFVEHAEEQGESYTYELNGLTITVSNPVLFNSLAVQVDVEAHDANGPIPTDNPYRFINPPIMVPDKNGDYSVIVGEDENGDPIYKYFREDIIAALMQIVYEAVVVVARKKGWDG